MPLLAGYLLVRRTHAPLAADTIGKVTTAAQLCTLAALASAPHGIAGEAGAIACAALGVATIAHYARTRV